LSERGCRAWTRAFAAGLVTVLVAAVASVPADRGTASTGGDGTPAARAEGPSAERPACQGVRLLSGPLIVSGITDPLGNTIVLEQIGPLDDTITCEPIELASAARPAGGERCEGAGVSAAKLTRRAASRAVRCLIDRIRGSHDLNALAAESRLKRAAKDHNRHMLDAGCFSHQCSGERDLVGRVTAAGYLPCGCTWTVGENLAWGVRARSSPAAIVEAWMHSPGHRDLILRKGIAEIGVGVIEGRPGDRNANAATYTADFGDRR
jgi:uncharacterized protein YkwD